jgi:hypothetical protein
MNHLEQKLQESRLNKCNWRKVLKLCKDLPLFTISVLIHNYNSDQVLCSTLAISFNDMQIWIIVPEILIDYTVFNQIL